MSALNQPLGTHFPEEPYFYFIDEQLGLCHFRVQTFFPFKVHHDDISVLQLAESMHQSEFSAIT